VSLDVYLNGEPRTEKCRCVDCDNEHDRVVSDSLYSANITHNLGAMAQEAGIYKHLWRPDEIGVTKAAQLIEPLRAGVALMRSDPARFEKHNAKNGWGLYKHFVPFVEEYLAACEAYPDATVGVSR